VAQARHLSGVASASLVPRSGVGSRYLEGGLVMAVALYRKYRPQTFAEVIGQEHVTEPLTQALRSGRLHHAYLFSGPRGCGKTSSARILARSLNCAKGPTPEPCGECDSCLALAPAGGGSVDVIEIDAASHGGVDDARELRERAFFAPVASRFKVYVIDEAHMVSTQGFNALLKLVEEPPEYVTFIFATTEPEKVLGTIKSRTHHYPFRLIPPRVLRPYLETLCQAEGVGVEPAVFPLVVRAGGGSARDSLSVLDQLIAGAGPDGVTYAHAAALLGVTDVALIDEMTDALAAGDGAAAFATVDRVAEAGHDPRRFASDLLERLRDLIVLQQVPDAAASGIIEAPEDQLERMSSQAARMGTGTVSRLADIAHAGLTEMRGTTAPRLLLELIVARMLLPGADDSQGALLHRLERMERRLTVTSPSGSFPTVPAPDEAPARTPTDPASPEARPKAAKEPTVRESAPGPASSGLTSEERARREDPVAPLASSRRPDASQATGPSRPEGAQTGIDAAGVRRVWDEVLTVIRRRSPRAWAVVREATVREVLGEEIVLVFQHAVHANMFGAQAGLLVEAIGEVLGGTWRVRAELGGDQTGRAPQLPDPEPQPVPERAGDWPTPARPGAPASGAPAVDPGASAAGPAPAPRSGSAKSAPAKKAAPQRQPAPRAAANPGFDPGDEPLDDAVDPATARQNSEEQAIRLLTEQLGAERIGE
jgi:DNA polymerase-3 subunit gamma/tau